MYFNIHIHYIHYFTCIFITFKFRFCGYLVILVLCVERTILSLIELSWHPCWKSAVNVRVFSGFFSPSLFFPSSICSPFYSYHTVLIHLASYLVLKLRSVNPLNLFFLSIVLTILGHLDLHINFRFNVIISANKASSYFLRDCIETARKFGSIITLTLLRLSICQHRCLSIY